MMRFYQSEPLGGDFFRLSSIRCETRLIGRLEELLAVFKPTLYGLDQRWDIGRLEQIVIHLAANGLHAVSKSG